MLCTTQATVISLVNDVPLFLRKGEWRQVASRPEIGAKKAIPAPKSTILHKKWPHISIIEILLTLYVN
jgi:hypothetical protein